MNLAVISTSRADLGIYSSFLNLCFKRNISISLLLTGCHKKNTNLNSFGIKEISYLIETGMTIDEKDSPLSTIFGITKTIEKVGHILNQLKNIDAVVVLGDRFEMHAAATAACSLKIPLIHFHGGELTYGSLDDKYRHSLTQLSDIHFASCKEYARRIVQLGVGPERVLTTGPLSLDCLEQFPFLSKEELNQRTGLDFNDEVCLLTVHPETLGTQSSVMNLDYLLYLLKDEKIQVLVTGVNLDPNWSALYDKLINFCKSDPTRISYRQSLGKIGYFSAMREAQFMVGNSSSGIIEAASFNLPVLNIGTRQKGRTQSENVINSSWEEESMKNSFKKVRNMTKKNFKNIYKNGLAAQLALDFLEKVNFQDILNERFFYDIDLGRKKF